MRKRFLGPRQAWAVAIAGFVLLAACGSTVPRAGSSGNGGLEGATFGERAVGGQGEGGLEAADARKGSAASSDAELRGEAGSPAAGAPGGPASNGGESRRRASAGADGREMGKGVSSDRVLVGVTWLDINSGAATIGSALGGDFENNTGAQTTREIAQAVVDHLNASGGIGGRQIEPLYFEYPVSATLQGETRRRTEQEMCSFFTEDHQVFAAIPFVSVEGVFTDCAAMSDTPQLLVGAEDSVDDQRFAEVGRWWYKVNGMAAERRERTMVARLLAQRFFDRDAKVGIMVQDKPIFRRGVERVLKPALAEAGVEVASEAAFPDLAESPWDTYALQFNSAGVTHVVWAHCTCGGAPPALFMRASENQRFRPRHALSSEENLAAMLGLNPPEEQLEGLGGIAWSPANDRGELALSDPPISSADASCRTIMQDAGFSPGAGHNYCETLFLLEAGLDTAPALTSDGLAAAIEGFHGNYVSAMTHVARFGPAKHDGVAAVHDLAYDAECRCFVYRSGPHPIT